jgi:Family of unknown function (DUF6174)
MRLRWQLIGLLMIVVACSDSPTEQQQDDLAAAQARWRAGGLTDYAFDLQHLCFCAPGATRTVTITVQQGVWSSIRYADDGTAADTALFRDYLTIDRLFSFLERAIAQQPDSFTASYDGRFGYPLEVWIDYSRQIADEELSLRIALHP